MATTTTEVISSANDLLSAHFALINRVKASQRTHRRQLRSLASPPFDLLRLPLILSPTPSPSPSPPSSPLLVPNPKPQRPDLPPAKRARVARYNNYVPEEETIRNDYSQRYVDGGEWPQNWVLGAEPEHRFEEYPKQQRLLALKKTSVVEHAVSPTFLPLEDLTTLHPCKFDVILIDPPFSSSFGWGELQDLPIPALAADPSFVFMWVGSGAGEGLERGREVLARWGYRRCEDVVWVKTNKTSNRGPGTDPPTTSMLTRTKQHCLIGIRGTVRRSTDSWFVHCNVDTDVIIWEGDASDPTRKPPEMYTLIENFCLGTRRLELFGRTRSSLRRGWVTALAAGEPTDGGEGDAVRWEKESWETGIRELAAGAAAGKCVVPMTSEIDALRPKSPFRAGASGPAGSGGGHGMGMGAGMGRGGFGVSMRGGAPGNQNLAQGQNQMMVQPMVGTGMPIGMGGMNSMGMDGMGWPVMGGGMGGMAGMGGMMSMQGMGMGGFQNQGGAFQNQGGNFQNQGMGGGSGFGPFSSPGNVQGMGMGMGWDTQGTGQGQYMDGMWDEGMMGDMGMGMGSMGMNVGMGGGMGMGNWGGANRGGYEAYR